MAICYSRCETHASTDATKSRWILPSSHAMIKEILLSSPGLLRTGMINASKAVKVLFSGRKSWSTGVRKIVCLLEQNAQRTFLTIKGCISRRFTQFLHLPAMKLNKIIAMCAAHEKLYPRKVILQFSQSENLTYDCGQKINERTKARTSLPQVRPEICDRLILGRLGCMSQDFLITCHWYLRFTCHRLLIFLMVPSAFSIDPSSVLLVA